MKMKIALTIAGSDCSGGAGIQADLKTMTMNGVFAMSVITALTAQNTTGVRAIQESTPDFLKQQLDAVFEDFISGIKNIAVNGVFETRSQIETDKVWDGYNMPVERVAPIHCRHFLKSRSGKHRTEQPYITETNNTPMLRLRPKRIRLHVIYAAMESAAPITGSACWEKENRKPLFLYRSIKNGCCLCPVDAKFPKERRDSYWRIVVQGYC